ncbi:hypothetical protein AB833_31900 [Chromatiales bacterium (ex Bugula neritina AB1)]|nr:hypothetical protein AB833_31900 [Chromatiales bacterium (ex Bugula neritina AB1)]
MGLFNGVGSKKSKVADLQLRQDLEGKMEAISRSQAIIEFDLKGNILFANDNFLNAMGYRLDEIKGRHHSLFVEASEQSSTEYANFWQQLSQGEFVSKEFKRIDKSGGAIWIQASYNPIFDSNGKPYKVVKFATDITERKIRDADVSGQLDAIYKSQAVIEFKLDGTILKANDNFLQTVGYQLSEIQGKHHRIFVESEYSNSRAYREFWDRLRRGEYQAGEFKRVSKSGEEVWIQASYNPILDASGRPSKIVKYASNVTEQKELQNTIELVLSETRTAVTAMASGDLTTKMKGQFTGQFAVLQSTVNECVDRMHSVLSNIRAVARNVTENSSDIASGNNNLSKRTVKQAANLEETAASMEEITTTVQDNASNASKANDLALSASTQAQKGGNIVRDAVKAMDGLNESSGKISDIIGVINDIAFQTNLLALNASVEAARAGTQGRGFAVVASEVRDLAGRSATAAKEIKELIEDSANRVDQSSKLVNQSGSSLDDIMEGVEKVTDIIANISIASNEQSLGISSVNNAITQIDELTQENATLVEKATTSSESLKNQANELDRLVSSFKLNDNVNHHAANQGVLVSGPASNSDTLNTRRYG